MPSFNHSIIPPNKIDHIYLPSKKPFYSTFLLQSYFSTVMFSDKSNSFGHSLRKLCIQVIDSQSLSNKQFHKLTNKHIKQLIFNSEDTNNFHNIFTMLLKKPHIYKSYNENFPKKNYDLANTNNY